MNNRVKVLFLTVSMVFIFIGVSFASPIPHDYTFEYYNDLGGSGLGAVVYLDITDPVFPGGDYSYVYQVQNVAYDPAGDGLDVINRIRIPVTLPVTTNVIDDGEIHVPTGFATVEEGGVNYLEVWFQELVPSPIGPPVQGLQNAAGPVGVIMPSLTFSAPFEILSTVAWDHGNAQIFDGGETGNLLVISNLDTTGGGNIGVPEPGTLLLLGLGLLGLGGWHRRFGRGKGRS
jgi:hypothetical protein